MLVYALPSFAPLSIFLIGNKEQADETPKRRKNNHKGSVFEDKLLNLGKLLTRLCDTEDVDRIRRAGQHRLQKGKSVSNSVTAQGERGSS